MHMRDDTRHSSADRQSCSARPIDDDRGYRNRSLKCGQFDWLKIVVGQTKVFSGCIGELDRVYFVMVVAMVMSFLLWMD